MSERNVCAIVQARMLSQRLRGKSLMAVAGIPLLSWVLDRIHQMDFVDEIVVATSEDPSDDPLAAYAVSIGATVFRGSRNDVLDRFAQAAANLGDGDVVLRFTADNPLYDPLKSINAYAEYLKSDADYLCIDGLSHIVPEFIRVGCLRDLAAVAVEQPHREHVTMYLRQQANDYKTVVLPADFSGLRPEYDGSFTVDRLEQLTDFELMVKEIGSLRLVDLQVDQCYRWLDDQKNRTISELLPGEKRMTLAGRTVGDGCPCFIIAEIGQNHNGQMNIAKKLIDMAARCGADAVKFQKRDIGWELTEVAYNSPYEGANSFGPTYGSHREFLELNEEQHRELKEYAQNQGLVYFCTPCDPPSVDILERLRNPIYKIASRDITNIPLLRYIAKTGKPVIISTGMAGNDEIADALQAFEGSACEVSLMQCVSQYPAEPKNINLRAMMSMRSQFDVLVALSDHTPGVITGVAGATLGAFAVEKHITLSRAMPGTDHAAALEEEGLRRLVNYIKTCETALGDGIKQFNPVAQSAKEKLARSLVNVVPIVSGQVITEDMLVLKSPGTGLTWSQRGQIVGKRARVDLPAYVTLQSVDFE